MARRLSRAIAARFDTMREYPVLRPFAAHMSHPALWSLHRRSVALGVAVGLFAGLIPGPLQMLGAGVLAVTLRCNFPIALVTTLYSNPLTIVPLYLLAYHLGSWVTGVNGRDRLAAVPQLDWTHLGASIKALVHWSMGLGEPLLVGLPILALVLAVLGYVLVRLGWSCSIRWQWQRRCAARAGLNGT